MSAWPIEELLWRPIATLLLALLVPVLTRKLLVVLLAPRGLGPAEIPLVAHAFTALLVIEALGFAFLGFTAIPAELGGATVRFLDALFAGGIAVGVGLWTRQRHVPRAASGTEGRGAGYGAGLLIGFALVAIGVLTERTTRIASDAIASTSADAAWRRLRIDPSDGYAMLAVAWRSAERNDLDEATARIDEAERMGAPEADLAEARAEIDARRGDCVAAWAHFDEALRLRAGEAFERGELPELGGYHLPTAMVTGCTPREGAATEP